MKKVVESGVIELSELEKQSLQVLIQAVQIAVKSGAFELEDAVHIGNAKNNLQGLIKEEVKK